MPRRIARAFHPILWLVLALFCDRWASAHFLVLLPSRDVVGPGDPPEVVLEMQFTHPMEQGPIMPMARPLACAVFAGESKADLSASLQERRVGKASTYSVRYRFEGPGDHVFTVLPAPYWEPAERKWIIHYTKVVANFLGNEGGWERAVGLPVEIHVGKTPEIMRAADCAMSVSGSVSLELLYHAVPTVILYWISRPAYFVQGFFRKVKYITLVNLLAGDALAEDDLSLYDPNSPEAAEALFPEYLTCEDRSTEVASHIIGWLQDRKSYSQLVERLQQLKDRVAHGGASSRAAEYLLATLQAAPLSGPHWRRPTEGEATAGVDAAAA